MLNSLVSELSMKSLTYNLIDDNLSVRKKIINHYLINNYQKLSIAMSFKKNRKDVYYSK